MISQACRRLANILAVLGLLAMAVQFAAAQ